MPPVSPDHPQLTLLFAIDADADDITEDAIDAMRAAIASLASSRSWTIAPPEFIDEEDNSSSTQPGDQPIVTVGGFVQLYSSFPPWGERLPTTVDRAQYEEAKAIVDAMATYSREKQLDLVFEYEDEAIGYIERGAPDEGLTVGLLAEWDRVLRDREARPGVP